MLELVEVQIGVAVKSEVAVEVVVAGIGRMELAPALSNHQRLDLDRLSYLERYSRKVFNPSSLPFRWTLQRIVTESKITSIRLKKKLLRT